METIMLTDKHNRISQKTTEDKYNELTNDPPQAVLVETAEQAKDRPNNYLAVFWFLLNLILDLLALSLTLLRTTMATVLRTEVVVAAAVA